MRAVTLVHDTSDPNVESMRNRGHWPMRDDRRQGRRAYVCVHCGGRMTHTAEGWSGTLGNRTSRCFPKPGDPLSRRDAELRDLDEEMGWGGTRSAIAEANWAAKSSRKMAQYLAQRR